MIEPRSFGVPKRDVSGTYSVINFSTNPDLTTK